ncbi:MAG: response regulator transcription factor [Anaerolineales bacterium]|nr:response regulator transcription factor [Anaerolineales bacterium]
MNQPSIIRVAIADHGTLVRAAVRGWLETEAGMQLVAEFEHGDALCAAIASIQPSVLLLDTRIPGPRAVDIVACVRKNCPDTAVVALATIETDRYLGAMVSSGVAGFLPKTITPEVLVECLRRAARGETLFMAEQLSRARRWSEEVEKLWLNLTERERTAAKALANGLENKAIATAMVVNLRTTETHVSKILDKLCVDSRLQAALWVRDHLPESWWR